MRKLYLPLIFLLLLLTGCGGKQKFEAQFFDVFDTVSVITVYTEDQDKANEYTLAVHDRLMQLHMQFDPYNTYDGVQNLKTINDNAGKAPTDITEDMYNVLQLGLTAYDKTDGAINIAMGSTLELWHKYRSNALENDVIAIPSANELEATRTFDDISALELTQTTAYITREGVSLNLGALAKGYAADEAVALLKEMGCDSALVNLGGNVCGYCGKARKEPWRVGVQDPFNSDSLLDVVEMTDGCMVTSGDYQRFYMYDGKKIHHIIDPQTLMPADRYNGVTVICQSSADGDMLSTALFIMDKKSGDRLAKEYGVTQVYRTNAAGTEKLYEDAD